MVRDKRTKHLDPFKKQNPFKPYNIRLKASKLQENCKIVSSDDDIMNLDYSHDILIFVCPKCGRIYEKRWCHWLEQKQNCHFCQNCLKKESSYEFLVRKWLEDNNICYEREFWFKDCKDIRVLPFDFMIKRKNKDIILIEVDGCQHYQESPMFINLSLEERKRKDEIKTNYCKKHGYTLLRLPYWDFSNDTYIRKLNETFFGVK